MNKQDKNINSSAGPTKSPEHNQSSYPLDRYTVATSGADKSSDKSPYYKSQAPTIELPKGGGALKGVDEKFTVNAVNGTSSLEVQLPVSQSRSGFTPKLSLQYNSGSGNSEFGLGWGLSLPAIQRKTDKKLPEYNDVSDSDVFVMAGAEDLVPLLYSDGSHVVIYPQKHVGGSDIPTGYRIKQYVPRTEGLFARIEFITREGEDVSWWRVTTKDNIVTYYGLTENSRIADPENTHRIFKWLPSFSYDRRGNAHQYHYLEDNNDTITDIHGSAHELLRLRNEASFVNKYIKKVYYCNNIPFFSDENPYSIYEPELTDLDYLMEVVFDYGDHTDTDNVNGVEGAIFVPNTPNSSPHYRKDPFSDFHAGFEIRTYRRCYRVLMFHRFDELIGDTDLNAVLVRSLNLEYKNGNHNADGTVYTETDYPQAVSNTGYVLYDTNPGGAPIYAYRHKSLPELAFTYNDLNWSGIINSVPKEDIENLPQGLTGSYQWIDLDGEGMPGVLTEQANGWFYKHNLGEGHFAPTIQVAEKPSFNGLGNNLQWQDIDADGRRHLVSTDPAMPGYFELNDDQEWERFKNFKKWINIDWKSPYTKVLDLNGDGKPDVLIAEERVWRWYENNGTDGYTNGGATTSPSLIDNGPRVLHNDMLQSIFLADINGDGLTDIVRIQNGEVCYWPNKGYGKFGAKVIMSNAPFFDRHELFNPLYITLSDISGTGAADIIYLGRNNCTAWINYSGNAWSQPIVINALPSVEPFSKVAVMDFTGSGTCSIVWSSPLPQHAHAPLRYIDLMGGEKPYLMRSYANGLGKTTTVTYKHSTKYYIEDKLALRPWATRLPFPVHCVEKVTTQDTVSETTYTQEYTYHHGYYDHEEREFRGFGMVEVKDTDVAVVDDSTALNQHPVLTKTWYHTGAFLRLGTLIERYESEYFNVASWNLPGIASFPDNLNVQEFREAHRVLKGSPLRQEIYALDGSPDEGIPYTVTANSYIVKCVQSQFNNRHASFFTHQQENLVWHCERNIDDPRILHELTLNVDQFGNVLEAAKVAYKRGVTISNIPDTSVALTHNAIIADMQRTTKITYTVNEFTNDVIDVPPVSGSWYPLDNYRLRMSKQVSTFELHGLSDPSGLWHPADLKEAFDEISAEIEFTEAPSGSSVQKRVLSKQRTVYLSDDTTSPLAFGFLASLGLVYQQYQLAFSNHILSDSNVLDGKVTDTMLANGGYIRENNTGVSGFGTSSTNYWLPSGTMEYFVGDVKATFFTPEKYLDPWGAETSIGYWSDYYLLPQSITDALSSNPNSTIVIEYDWRCLQPTMMQDPNENVTQIVFDELCLPVLVAMNGKVGTGVEADEIDVDIYSSSDVAAQTDFWNNPADTARDLLGLATWRCVYDFERSPAAVAMIAREQHANIAPNSPMLIRMTYTDGLGRVAMHKVQAEPNSGFDPCWIGSGKTIYNNKGKEVMQYEPYFSDTHDYDPAEQAAHAGVSPKVHYDPLGRVERTDLPDGSYTKIEWDAWAQKVYDNNDTVKLWNNVLSAYEYSDWYKARAIVNGVTGSLYGIAEEQDAAAKALEHANTPTIMLLDVLAQPFYTIQHNRYITSGTTWGDFYYQSYVRLDLLGNRIEIRDARTGMASSAYMTLQYKYDMLRGVIKQVSADSGTQYLLAATDGQPYYAWDADNREFRFEYDEIRRMTLKEVDTGSLTVLERVEYGEGITNAKNNNLYGKPYKHYDGGGLLWTKTYDFKGNPLTAWRTFTTDYEAHPNWLNIGSVSMESTDYVTENSFDALNRLSSITHKTHTSGGTVTNGKTNYGYDKAGLLKTVDVANISTPSGGSGNLATDIINDITYDAKRQRLSVDYENGATTTYEYYDDTFRVKKILTERVVSGTTQKLQELKYWYDPVGNITTQTDGALQSVFYANTVVSPDNYYTYDALYRLIIAEGREQKHENEAVSHSDNYSSTSTNTGRTLGSTMPFLNSINANDKNALQRYTQKYSYDETGNMLQMKHWAGTSNSWTRDFTISNTNNRTTGSSIGSNTTGTETLSYDTRGNLTGGLNHLLNGSSTHTDTMEYNAENRLQKVWVNGTTIQAFYQYDADGQRIRKVWKNTSGTILRTRLYIGDWELYTDKNYVTNAITLQRETLNVMDDQSRIALVDTPTTLPGGSSETQLLRYQFSNHLSTVSLELSSTAAIISYEEYYPYGSTSFQSGRSGAEVSLKRYRYTGKERDEETGLYYHGARYYAPWLARWCASDPINSEFYNQCKGNPQRNIERQFIELCASTYEYCYANPIRFNDPTGEQAPRENSSDLEKMLKDQFLSVGLSINQKLLEGFAETIMDTNKSIGRMVDNQGKDRMSPGKYKDADYRAFNNQDVFKHQGGQTKQGKYTTKKYSGETDYQTKNVKFLKNAATALETAGTVLDISSLINIGLGKESPFSALGLVGPILESGMLASMGMGLAIGFILDQANQNVEAREYALFEFAFKQGYAEFGTFLESEKDAKAAPKKLRDLANRLTISYASPEDMSSGKKFIPELHGTPTEKTKFVFLTYKNDDGSNTIVNIYNK